MMLQLPRVFAEQASEIRQIFTARGYYQVDELRDFSARFKLSLHEAKSLSDLRADFINIKAGNSYEILVNPSVLLVGCVAL